MTINVASLGTVQENVEVQKVTIENNHWHKLGLVTWGASWQSFQTAAGVDLTLGFQTAAGYLDNNYYIGNIVGRTAGRIDGARFELDGQEVVIPANEDGNLLHGGVQSFSHRNWTIEAIDEAMNRVTFGTKLTSDEDHFPGDMRTTVTYTLTENDEVKIQFTAESTATTLYNPTAHVYFNLGGVGTDARKMQLQIKADRYMELRADKVPTGNLLPVAGTAYDFREPQLMGAALEKLPSDAFDKKFDDVFALNGDSKPDVILTDPASQRSVEISTDRNAMVCFITNPEVDNYADQEAFLAEHPYNGIALEAQTLSDSIHHPELGDIILPVNQTQTYVNTYAFKNI